MRMKRIALVSLVALGLAPGTFVRSEPSPKDYSSPVMVRTLDVARLETGPLTLEGAWQLSSENDHFGGFSSLVMSRSGRLVSASDAGRLMVIPRPDRPDETIAKTNDEIVLKPFLAFRQADKMSVDVESLAIDPQTGDLWVGLEWTQEIIALGPKMKRRDAVRPPEMKDWGSNSGPEAMVRLDDGRFVVIEEHSLAAGQHEALLFPRDPLGGERPIRFVFQARDGYRPSDAAPLPDGRIAVLLRGIDWGFPPLFPALIVIADPGEIAPDGVLASELLARIEAPLPNDNFEGMTVIEDAPGQWDFWLLSDDNFASYQRTLLLKLRWDIRGHRRRQKARR